MIDNKEKIRKLLIFDSKNEDIYYYAQIIKRRKDNPELNKSEVKISSIFLTSQRKLDEYWDFIKERADKENARVYISLTPRSLKKFTGLCLVEFSKRMMNNTFSKTWKIPDQCALRKNTIRTRGIIDGERWVVDIDSRDTDQLKKINKLFNNNTRTLDILDTPGGYHIIISPFNYRKLDNIRVSMERDDYSFNENSINYEFTLRREGNTILYTP